MRSPLAVRVVVACLLASPVLAADLGWPNHGGDPGHRQHSSLAQIHRGNVKSLRVAWTYASGGASPDGRSQIQCNPIVVDGVLYATSPRIKVFALDAATGREKWSFDPFASGTGTKAESVGVNRGVTYWASGTDRRILFTAGPRLFALDAKTGRPIPTFGDKGSVSLLDGLDRDVTGLYVMSRTPGAIYKDLLILGTVVSEGPGASAPGHVRAYDVRTGKIAWIFHTIPHPGELGHDTWSADAWTKLGGANAWSGISVDADRGLVFLPTGSAAFDFWGGNREGANLFADCVLVLKAATGERAWHYQLVHHDLWDRDLPAAPALVRVTRDGRKVDAVAQITKSGHVFVFERETGKPLFPIEEKPVSPSDLQDERAWPTQPLPVLPPAFARQRLTEADLGDLDPESHRDLVERFRKVRSAGQWVPPSREGTVIFPGFDGGGEWGGAAFDEDSGLLYVNANEMPWVLTMVPIDRGKESTDAARGRLTYQQNCVVCHGIDQKGDPQGQYPGLVGVAQKRSREEVDRIIAGGKGVMPSFGMLTARQREDLVAFLFGDAPKAAEPGDDPPDDSIPYTHTGYNRFLDKNGYPGVKPPWGTLNAIDLNAGAIRWTKALGELPELKARGLAPTGTENYGGPVVTAGGLLFIAATRDEKFRAFDKDTGEVLFETALPAGGYATPSTYSVGGKQFVVIACGGGKMGTKSGDTYVAFALP
ncbi:MAG TPA: PQQ-binding-like beta-propeller repeat protein [Vicinamibacteria bacterium]|nr:PQQ-binding-like beta-propeller repeat protein [Vicinamibacteria bacterium]